MVLEITISTIKALSQLTLNALDGTGSLLVLFVVGWIGYLIVKSLINAGKKLANGKK